MPRISVIRQDGSGDYTSVQAWIAAERTIDYGSVTIGRIDGFFDFGGINADLGTGWANGARLEAFDQADAFDGTSRQLCGFTGTASQTLRNRGSEIELSGLEIYNTGSGIPYWNTNSALTFYAEGCLFRSTSNALPIQPAATVTGLLTNCVMHGEDRGYNDGGSLDMIGCTVFADTGSAVASIGGSPSLTDVVTVNGQSPAGICYRGDAILNNCAATDETADAFDNIIVANEFVNPDPASSGDYRIDAAGTIGAAGVGAFIFAAGTTYTFTAANISFTTALTGVQLTVGQVQALSLEGLSVSYDGPKYTASFAPESFNVSFK
jgi:hypothetical protein